MEPPVKPPVMAMAIANTNDKDPTSFLAFITPFQTPYLYGDRTEEASTDKEHEEQVRVVNPIVIAKVEKTTLEHILDWGPWFCGVALVIVGGLQVWFLRGTLKATAKAADAARTSAQIAMGVSVPRLILNEFAVLKIGAASIPAILQYPMLRIRVKNYGQSPAFLKSYSVIVTYNQHLPDEPLFERPQYFDTGVVADAEKEFTLGEQDGHDGIRLDKVADADIRALAEGKKCMTIYGYIEYGDVFGSPSCDVRFCKTLVELGSGGEWNPFYVDDGGAKYHGQHQHQVADASFPQP